MKTNDIKKGMIIRLDYGLEATVFDNRRGNIRTVEVDGVNGLEISDIAAWRFSVVQVEGRWVPVTLTPQQERLRALQAW
jgi:hypothetical protein